jgi:hypothetical protein
MANSTRDEAVSFHSRLPAVSKPGGLLSKSRNP